MKDNKNINAEDLAWKDGKISSIVKIAPEKPDKENSKQLGSLENTGWYYDQQLLQPLTSVRLYSNKEAEYTSEGKWVFKQVGDKNEYKVLLATSILSEDFVVDVTNSWVDNSADDMIGGALNSFKTLTPYLGTFHNALKKMSQTQGSKQEGAEAGGLKATSFITKVVDYLGKDGSNGSKALEELRKASNGAFLAQGCSFTYYGGTGVNFGNLGMKFTIFPTFNAESGEWISVIKQVALLLPYSIGVLEDLPEDLVKAGAEVINDGIEKIDNVVNTSIGDFLQSVIDTVKESSGGKDAKDLINQYIKWQAPPGGYDVDSPKDIDANHPGTLCLEVGPHYKIEGLVISSISLQFSKQLVKKPDAFSGIAISNGGNTDPAEDTISPLYCEVNLMLRPITKYSSKSLLRFIYGNIESRKAAAKDILDSLGGAADDFIFMQNDSLDGRI